MPSKRHIDIEAVRDYISAGLTRPEIESCLGVCRKTLAIFLRENGLATRGNKRNNFGRRTKRVERVEVADDGLHASPSVRALGGNPFGLVHASSVFFLPESGHPNHP